MDKLYAGTNPIGVISEMLLAVLNSNVHVYHVSPVLTLMEIEVTKAVGQLFNMGPVKYHIKYKLYTTINLQSKIGCRWFILSRWFGLKFISYGDST